MLEPHIQPGIRLQIRCQQAQNEVFFCAPFIKYTPFQRLLTELADNVAVWCVTRWYPHEIASGVSDPDIWLLLKDRPGSKLLLHSDLHAKYYRTDNTCLVGSANLTGKTLGWSSHPNMELLLEFPANALQVFENDLLRGCVTVDDDLYQQVKLAAEKLDKNMPDITSGQELLAFDEEINHVPVEAWIPTLRHPENLYTAYQGRLDELGTGSRIAAISDLQTLNIPPSLQEDDFNTCIATQLLQKPVIQRIDRFVTKPRRFGEVRDLLSTLPCANANEDFDPSRAWQTLMRWLLFFMVDRYKQYTPNYTEIFTKLKNKEN